jgi:hypothetical protein
MKKVLLVFGVLLVMAGFAFSADLMDYPPPLEGGNFLVDAGIGWALSDDKDASIKIPPVAVSAEYCIPTGAPISIGALVGFYQFNWGSWKETWTYLTFGARANWHWNIEVCSLDLYTGVFIGYTNVSLSGRPESRGGPSPGGFKFGGQAGMHYYFSDRVGAVLELGYPFIVKAGAAFKF